MKTLFGVPLLLCTVLLAGSGQQSAAQIPGAGAVTGSDDKFLRTAATTALMEVRLAKLGQERGSRPEVRAYAKQMTDAHSATNENLRELAGRKGVALPSDVDGSQQKAIDDLSKLAGSAFDDAFLDTMARAHQKDVNEFENAAKEAEDPGVKGFAQKTLPMLKKHLARAEALKRGGR
jgi:putative membrane protein